MIVGKGSLSKLLNDREGFIFFAAGVGNSEEVFTKEFVRERERILKYSSSDQMFVYFSTISINTHQSLYTSHEQNMELYIKLRFTNYTIIRLGNIWECTNPNTFINAYKTKPYEPRDEWKYMISKEQLQFVTDNLP